MIQTDHLKEMTEKCVRCGICQSVCPVFAELEKEAGVARGKVSLIRKILSGEVGYSPKMSTYFLQCLGCGACSENCPNGVKAEELILAARALLVEKKGLSFPKRLVFRGILRSAFLLPMLLKAGSLLQGLLLKKISEESGLHLRFSLPYLDKDRCIPSIADPFLLDRYSEEIGSPRGRKKIGLFAGCSINYLFPSIGESTIRLLTQNNFSVVLCKDQTCCGLPAYGSGDLETARSLARKNMKAFEFSDIDQIIVPCASCFYFLKEGYLKLFPDDETAKTFSQKVADFSTFFVTLPGRSAFQGVSASPSRTVRVTYHDPCHLRRGMKIYEEPRKLLQSLPGIELAEMKKPNRCCGMAGSFNFVYYELSKKILKRKLDDIAGTEADYVVTGCMGCLIQLKDGLYQNGMEIMVNHPVEVLEKFSESPFLNEEKGL